MHALQQHLPVEVDQLTLLPRTKRTHESLKDVLTAIVGEEHTEFNLRVGKRIDTLVVLAFGDPSGATQVGAGISNVYSPKFCHQGLSHPVASSLPRAV
jgi:hypothetical protein